VSEVIKEKFTQLKTKKEEFLFGLGLSRSSTTNCDRRKELAALRETGASTDSGVVTSMSNFAMFQGLQAARKDQREESSRENSDSEDAMEDETSNGEGTETEQPERLSGDSPD